MKIVVLNGSPKGMVSVTMQYILWLRKILPTHEFTILDVCHDLRRLEDDERAFGEVLREIEAADGVLWAFPFGAHRCRRRGGQPGPDDVPPGGCDRWRRDGGEPQ